MSVLKLLTFDRIMSKDVLLIGKYFCLFAVCEHVRTGPIVWTDVHESEIPEIFPESFGERSRHRFLEGCLHRRPRRIYQTLHLDSDQRTQVKMPLFKKYTLIKHAFKKELSCLLKMFLLKENACNSGLCIAVNYYITKLLYFPWSE